MTDVVAIICLVGWVPILALCFGVAAIIQAVKNK